MSKKDPFLLKLSASTFKLTTVVLSPFPRSSIGSNPKHDNKAYKKRKF